MIRQTELGKGEQFQGERQSTDANPEITPDVLEPSKTRGCLSFRR